MRFDDKETRRSRRGIKSVIYGSVLLVAAVVLTAVYPESLYPPLAAVAGASLYVGGALAHNSAMRSMIKRYDASNVR